ncbi:nucleoside hydrolase [Demequina sp. SYSU T00068]|uniref:nucleoside hydrolase n=1 Tax=Demequina lignilytica TaxID=3051663 RepID=UPI00261C9CF9|nr:nucleoside hydrolase [Demequina sp. SYSU T00068]MDN4491645.1 nucleoside hydrolase [Demequina sp. SYSU T00068]
MDSLPPAPSDARWTLDAPPWLGRTSTPRARVIIDNDFSGDPDDLYQLVHHLLSPSVEIRLVVASHLAPNDPFDDAPDTAANAEAVVRGVFSRMGLESTGIIVRGASAALPGPGRPADSVAARAIIAEAMREDADTPLYYAAGGGLTDLATALLLEPRIATRLTLIWIGGPEHADLAFPPPAAMPIEYNLLIDVEAGRVVMGPLGPTIWQVPRDVYRQCLVSDVELRARVRATGALGAYLYDEVQLVHDRAISERRGPAETYALGDSPLVLLTALQSLFEADPSSSRYSLRPTPELTAEGAYRPVAGARPMRVYTRVDVRLMFEDFYLKLREFSRWQEGQG